MGAILKTSADFSNPGFGGAPNYESTVSSHTQADGTDRYLMAVCSMSNLGTVDFTGSTWNGTAMTDILQYYDATLGHKWAIFVLDDPDAGNHDFVVGSNFPGPNGAVIAVYLASFTGCTGYGNIDNQTVSVTPNTGSITISEDSLIHTFSVAEQDVTGITINSSRTLEYDIHVPSQSRYYAGAYSESGLAAGTYNTSTELSSSFPTSRLSNTSIELQSAADTPVLTVSETSLNGFTYQEGSGPSAEQTFTVSGDFLTGNTTVSGTTNYEISETSGSGFGSSITLTQSGGNIVGEPVTIYVRLKAGLSEGSYNNEDITVSSGGAVTKTVTASGSVTAASSTRRRIMITQR